MTTKESPFFIPSYSDLENCTEEQWSQYQQIILEGMSKVESLCHDQSNNEMAQIDQTLHEINDKSQEIFSTSSS